MQKKKKKGPYHKTTSVLEHMGNSSYTNKKWGTIHPEQAELDQLESDPTNRELAFSSINYDLRNELIAMYLAFDAYPMDIWSLLLDIIWKVQYFNIIECDSRGSTSILLILIETHLTGCSRREIATT